jgi:hypothetical protein
VKLFADKRWITLPTIRRAACRQQLDQYTLTGDKDDVVAPYVARAAGQDRIVLIGKAQEKTTTFRTTQGHGPRSQARYPRLYRTTAMVNHYYFYGVDCDFGPFFL